MNGRIDTVRVRQGKLSGEVRDVVTRVGQPSPVSGYLERLLFPQSRLQNFVAIIVISASFPGFSPAPRSFGRTGG